MGNLFGLGGLQYPVVNGNFYSFVSIEALIAGQRFHGWKSVNYTWERERGMVEGTNPDPLGKTRGKNTYKADCELYLPELNQLLDNLGQGFGDVTFSLKVTYSETGFKTITDTLVGCTLDSIEASQGVGTDPLVRKFNLSPLNILYNGKSNNKRRLGGIGLSSIPGLSAIASAVSSLAA